MERFLPLSKLLFFVTIVVAFKTLNSQFSTYSQFAKCEMLILSYFAISNKRSATVIYFIQIFIEVRKMQHVYFNVIFPIQLYVKISDID